MEMSTDVQGQQMKRSIMDTTDYMVAQPPCLGVTCGPTAVLATRHFVHFFKLLPLPANCLPKSQNYNLSDQCLRKTTRLYNRLVETRYVNLPTYYDTEQGLI